MNDREYKITEVQTRKEWTGKFGTFQDYALKLESADGWVALTQKPETAAPQVGDVLFGHIEVETRGENTFSKFKKVQRDGGGSYQQSAPQAASSNEDTKYIIQMLEELTGRRKKEDVAPDHDDIEGEPFNLDEIPF